jgi:hypothetical protein
VFLAETLKIREKSLTEQMKSRIEMETYCNKLEAKNTELEFMVKTLQRSIEQHEQSSDNPSTSPVNTTTNSLVVVASLFHLGILSLAVLILVISL